VCIVGNSPSSGRSWPSVAVADTDNNGSLDIVAAYGDGYVATYQGNGSYLSGWPQQPTAGYEIRSLAVGDVQGNVTQEILVCATRSCGFKRRFVVRGCIE
jgi:hypothetical protein